MAKDFEKIPTGEFQLDQIQENVDLVVTELNEEIELFDPDELRRLKEEAELALADAIAATAAANAASGKADAAQATADAIEAEYVKDVEASGNNIVVTHEDDTTTSIPIVTTETQSDWNETDTGDSSYIKNKPTTISSAQALAITNNSSDIDGIEARYVEDLETTTNGTFTFKLVTNGTLGILNTYTPPTPNWDGNSFVNGQITAQPPVVTSVAKSGDDILVTTNTKGIISTNTITDIGPDAFLKSISTANAGVNITVTDQDDDRN